MPDTYIVRSSAISPALLDRMFRRDEAVTKDDFHRCPWFFDKLIERGSITPAEGKEKAEGEAKRLANARADLGMGADTPPEVVLAALKERRLAEQADQERSVRILQASQAAALASIVAAATPPASPAPPAGLDQEAKDLRAAAAAEAGRAVRGEGEERKAAAAEADAAVKDADKASIAEPQSGPRRVQRS